ncbi:MAG TPA: glycosyltransferase family 4 protein [Gaiellaceae bacterium]|nr:glycosyltransferase family 4 protein [Gaiellaceae bacterium]
MSYVSGPEPSAAIGSDARRRFRRIVSDAPLPGTLSGDIPAPPEKRGQRSGRLRIILLSQYFSPEIGATQTRAQTFAEYLAARGHDVTVITEVPNHPHGVVPSEYRGLVYEDDRSNAYRILRVWVKTSREKNQQTRLAFYLSFMAMAVAVSPVAGGADVVFATSPPLFVGLAGLVISRLKRAAFVLDVRDLWPAAASSLSQISPGRVTRIAEGLERLLYRKADVVTCVTRPFCEHVDAIRERLPRPVFLPNGTLDLFFAERNGAFRGALGVSRDRFLVTFAGTHGIAQALPTVLAAAELSKSYADFAFIGEGPLKDRLVGEARERGLDTVHFHPQVPLASVPDVLAAADALVVPLSSHPTFSAFIPSKLMDFMASGRPVIVAAAGEPARMLHEAQAGIAVPPEDAGALANAVQWLASNRVEARLMGERGRRYAMRYPRRAQAERLETLLTEVARPSMP